MVLCTIPFDLSFCFHRLMKANTIYKLWYRPTDGSTTGIRESMYENGIRLRQWFAVCVCDDGNTWRLLEAEPRTNRKIWNERNYNWTFRLFGTSLIQSRTALDSARKWSERSVDEEQLNVLSWLKTERKLCGISGHNYATAIRRRGFSPPFSADSDSLYQIIIVFYSLRLFLSSSLSFNLVLSPFNESNCRFTLAFNGIFGLHFAFVHCILSYQIIHQMFFFLLCSSLSLLTFLLRISVSPRLYAARSFPNKI